MFNKNIKCEEQSPSDSFTKTVVCWSFPVPDGSPLDVR